MPLHLVSRRHFFLQFGAAVALSRGRAASAGGRLVAVLNDTHLDDHPWNGVAVDLSWRA